MWVGNPKELTSNDPEEALEIPAWSFIIEQDEAVSQLKGILAKVMFETNMQKEFEKSYEEEDKNYIHSQVVGDNDIDMNGVQEEIDYEYLDMEYSESQRDDLSD